MAAAELWCQGSGGAAAAWRWQRGRAGEAGGSGGRCPLPLHRAGGREAPVEQPVPGAAAGAAKPPPKGECPGGCQPSAPSHSLDTHSLLQLQELPWQWNSPDSPELLGEAEDQSASGSEGESPEGKGWELWGAHGLSNWGGGDDVLDLPPELGMGQCADLCSSAMHHLPPGHWGGRCWERLPVLCICSHQACGWVLPLVSPSLSFALFQDVSGWRHLGNHVPPPSLTGSKCK